MKILKKYLYGLILLFPFISLFTTLAHAQFDRKTGPVTAETRLNEYKKLMGNRYFERTKDDYCKKDFDQLIHLKQFLYKVDGNLPQINESKNKRLEFLDKQFFSGDLPEGQQEKIFNTEMFPDPDYHIFILKKKLKEAIQGVESLNWDYSRKVFDSYLKNLRSKEYYSHFLQQDMRDLLNHQIKVKDQVRKAFDEISDVRKNLSTIGHSNKLDKSLGTSGKDSYDPVLLATIKFNGNMNAIISCELDYLTRF